MHLSKPAVSAQLAVAIAILTFAPVRLANLVSIELGQNLIKPGGPNTPYWLVFPQYDVKNRVDLNFQFDQPLTDLIDEYVQEFRPALLRGANASWLFPGEAWSRRRNLFSNQITVRIQKAIGLRITLHQFRHAAAAIYLKHRPGDYETVRRLLGHRDIMTTIHFYCGLETMQATEQFGKLIRQQSNSTFRDLMGDRCTSAAMAQDRQCPRAFAAAHTVLARSRSQRLESGLPAGKPTKARRCGRSSQAGHSRGSCSALRQFFGFLDRAGLLRPEGPLQLT